MLGLGTLTFATPLALGALALLPVIWWLLRFTPPRPRAVRFPPFRLLLDLISREEQPDRTPWWLVALRLALVTLIILAVARPLLVRDEASGLTGKRLLIVVDDGWAAARQWPQRERILGQFIDAAEGSHAPVALAATAPQAQLFDLRFRPADEIRDKAATIAPKALETDRLALLERLTNQLDASALQVVWLADGLDSDDARAFAEGLQGLAGGRASVQVIQTLAADLGLAMSPPSLQDGGFNVTVRRPSTAAADQALVRILASNGRSLAERPISFADGSDSAEETFSLPLELRNEAARLEIADERTAASVYLFDDSWRRKTVGLVSGAAQELDQPLLSPLYYVSRALEPTSELREPDGGGLRALLEQDLSMLVVADVGILARDERQRVEDWVEGGGVLVRFAGPRLAGGNDDLVPVELRRGDRTLGSALAWEQAQPLAPFPDSSPFAGLQLDESVEVNRQVLAEPTPDLHDKVWASLADGTPLITAAKRGNGLLVLVHVTANAEWSNLPLSGLFVEMLNRIVELAPAADSQASGKLASGKLASGEPAGASGPEQAWVPRQALDGFGMLGPPGGDAVPLPARDMRTAKPSPVHPAGLYERAGALRALNLVPETGFAAMGPLPSGIAVRDYEISPPRDLSGLLFTAALVLLLIDCIAALALAGALTRLRFKRAAASLLIAGLGSMVAIDGARAQADLSEADRFAMRAALETRLAYVLTGDRQIDEVSFAGLSGLTDFLAQRSSVEAAIPMGIDIERDEIVFFPLIYWPVTPESEVPSPEALAKIDTFMKTGGTIFFDTRDADSDLSAVTGQPGPATLALRRILENLDIPPLETVPPDHVITKAFYLLQSFPGRWADGRLWVEASESDALGVEGRADGVSSIVIGSNDYAAAWAISSNGRPLFPAVPGGERQREFAYRTGLNIVMYAMTGNYKADQVHVPALLERLGQ
jgi:hypothetical protein